MYVGTCVGHCVGYVTPGSGARVGVKKMSAADGDVSSDAGTCAVGYVKLKSGDPVGIVSTPDGGPCIGAIVGDGDCFLVGV